MNLYRETVQQKVWFMRQWFIELMLFYGREEFLNMIP